MKNGLFKKGFIMPRYLKRFLCLLLILILAEFFIRAAFFFTKRDVRAYQSTARLVHDKHPFLGYTLKPNMNFKHKGVIYRTNSMGFRGGEFDPKDKRPFRVFVLGGSDVFNLLAEYNRPFCELLQNKLKDKYPDRSIEIVNAGVPGYTTFQSLINFSTRILDYNPDAIIIYHSWNDIKYWPYVSEEINYSQLSQLRGKAVERNLLGRLGDEYYTLAVIKALIRVAKYRVSKEKTDVIETAFTHVRKRNDTRYGELVYRRNLEGIIGIAKKQDVKVLLVNPLTLVKEKNTKEEAGHINYRLVHVPPDELYALFKKAGDILEDLAASEGASYIDLNRYLAQDLTNMMSHVHLTMEGNDAVAELIADRWDDIW
jgi:lysophospholipase L1-like esterase